jgi:hypothetical protein
MSQEYHELRRTELRLEYGALYDEVLRILNDHCSCGLDEYELETQSILPYLADADSVEYVQQALCQVLEGELPPVRGDPDAWDTWLGFYAAPAHDIWAALQRHQLHDTKMPE